jgi:PAS domain S-box-containing protein
VREIDIYETEACKEATKTYISILKDKIHSHEQQLLEAQKLADIGSFEWQVDSEEVIATPQLREIFGVTSGSFNRNELLKYVHPGDRERIQEAMKKTIAEGVDYDSEYRFIRDGVEKVIWSRGKLFNENGKKVLRGTSMNVTGKHHMVQRLQRSENMYKQAQALAHMGNYAYDIIHNKIEWTDEIFRIFGVEPQSIEVTLETFMSFVHPEDKEMVAERIAESIKQVKPHNFFYRIITANGKVKILQAIGEVLADEEGVPYKFLGTAQDVTEKELLIERLQESERLYKQAQAISHVGNWTWDIRANKISWSDELYKIFGLWPQDEEVTFERYLSFIHADDREKALTYIKQTLSNHQPFENTYTAVLDNDDVKYIHSKGEVELDATGKPVKLYGICQDVTEQQVTSRQLQRNREFIQKIADVTPSIITSYNIHTGQYVFVNQGMETLLGYSADEVLKGGVEFVAAKVHPDDIPSLMEKNNAAIEEANKNSSENEVMAEFKYRVLHKNGTYRWLHTYGTVFDRNSAGQVEHVLNVSVDITEQEEAERDLHQKNMQLQQSNSSLEEYAYVASHDLKEPLRKISTFGDRLMVSQYEHLNDDGKLYLDKIINSSRRMQAMINDLLSISMIAGNKSFEPYSLQKILDEVQQTLEYKIEEKEATIVVDEMPVVSIVPSQFRQLFQNLISNSLKFTRDGEKPHISISGKYLRRQDVLLYELAIAKKYLQISVTDNGIGFDNRFASKIFTIFQRLHGKDEYEGTGIGLAICKKIAENHGGTIFAESKLGEGTTFHIIIPVF